VSNARAWSDALSVQRAGAGTSGRVYAARDLPLRTSARECCAAFRTSTAAATRQASIHTEGNGASQGGLAIGGDQFVHAPSSRGVVREERFSTDYWRRRIVGTGRIGDLGTKE
jgi:hypothetical protein